MGRAESRSSHNPDTRPSGVSLVGLYKLVIGVYRAYSAPPVRMTSISELLKEAIWSLEMDDAPNAAFCVDRASALLGTTSTGTSRTPPRKRKLKKTKTKPKKKPRPAVNLLIAGTLPDNLFPAAFRSAVLPMMEDVITGEVMYKGFIRLRNGTYCYNFTGMCPVHGRVHTNVGPWQLKQHTKSEWCGWKCWKQDSYIKLFSNPILCSF